MTITKSSSAPLVVVVGATGNQGGSVIKALEESDKPYRIRAFTRNATKPSAQELANKGVQIVVVSLTLDNVEGVHEAFVGADFAFLVTNFWEHINMAREVAEGKLLIDAAKAGGASGIIWSGLPSYATLSSGKYKNVFHFEGKAEVAAYGLQSGVPFVEVQCAIYASNFASGPMGPQKQPDGSFAICLPAKPMTLVPVIDTVQDYGLYIREVLEKPKFPNGSEVRTGTYISLEDLATQLASVTGKTIVFKEITAEEFGEVVKGTGAPPHIVLDMTENLLSLDEFGYFGGKPTAVLEGVARKPRTWLEYVQDADWSKLI